MHLALTATCQKPMHNPAASIGLPVVDLQVNVARSFRPPRNPTNQIVSMMDEAAFLSIVAICTLINQELTIMKSMGNQKQVRRRMISFRKLFLKAILYVVCKISL
jgi:hypothetical protein